MSNQTQQPRRKPKPAAEWYCLYQANTKCTVEVEGRTWYGVERVDYTGSYDDGTAVVQQRPVIALFPEWCKARDFAHTQHPVEPRHASS